MQALFNIARNARSLSEVRIAVNIWKIRFVNELIVELNANSQLFKKGEYTDGSVVGVYSLTTQSINPDKELGKPYNFSDTGDFLNSFNIILNNDGSFVIEADDEKEDIKLTEEYNEGELLGLSVESLNKLVETITPFFIRETREALFK